jgi:hypothetical protein
VSVLELLEPLASSQIRPAVLTERPAQFQSLPLHADPSDMEVSGLGEGTLSVARVRVVVVMLPSVPPSEIAI